MANLIFGSGVKKADNPLREFAKIRTKLAASLGIQAGFDVPEPERDPPAEPYLPPPGGKSPKEGSTTNPALVFKNTLLEGGLPAHAVEGIMWNGKDESGFNPSIVGDGGNALGILQWNGPRKKALENFAAELGASPHDPAVQAKFTLHELNTSHKGVYDGLMASKTPNDAAVVFLNQFEIPAEKHRIAREAAYRGGASGDFAVPNNLTFGPEIEAQDPMAPEHVGRGAPTETASQGMDAEAFQSLKDKYGERTAMNILNSSGQSYPSTQPYPDAILRFLQEGSEEVETGTAAEKQAAVLAARTGDFPLGTEVPDDGGGAGVAASSGGGAPSSPQGAPPATSDAADGEKPKLTAVDRMFNAIYGTDVEDMTDDERADRRRAVGLAMGQGFAMLSRGTPMDMQPIMQQRMDLQTARRAAADLKQNAQGVSDMLIASGMPELAQLPFVGESGMNAAMNALVTSSTAGGGDAPFDLSPEVRATVAQTMADMGQGSLAEQMMNMPAGEGLKELYQATLGVETKSPTEGSGNEYTPENRAAIASQFDAVGNTFAADAIRNGLDAQGIRSLVEAQGSIDPKVATAAGVAAAEAGVDDAVQVQSAEDLARGYDAAGLTKEAEVARAAGSGEEAKLAVADMRASDVAAKEAAAIKERGEAVAALVPDDLENAEELKAAAKAATTSEDLNRVYEMIAEDEGTTEQKLYDLAKKDPAFLPFVMELSRAKAGAEPKKGIAVLRVTNEIEAAGATFLATQAGRRTAELNMEMVRSIASNPDFTSGKIQETVLLPAQQYLSSIMGEAAPDIVSDPTMTGARLVELVQNSMFASMTSALKGAISDRETGYIRATLPSVGDTRTQLLAVSQYHVKIAEIQEAEYNAMMEWAEKAETEGNLGDRASMMRYIDDKVGDMKVFDIVTEDNVDEWFDSPDRQLGEVVQVMRPDGSSTYVSFTAGE